MRTREEKSAGAWFRSLYDDEDTSPIASKNRKKAKNKNSPRTNPTTPVVGSIPSLKPWKSLVMALALKIGWPGRLRYRSPVSWWGTRVLDGFHSTTNNRMEMMGALIGRSVWNIHATLFCTLIASIWKRHDTVDEMVETQWMDDFWQKPVKNVDLWKRLDEAASRHNVAGSGLKATPGIVKMKYAIDREDRSFFSSRYASQERYWFCYNK